MLSASLPSELRRLAGFLGLLVLASSAIASSASGAGFSRPVPLTGGQIRTDAQIAVNDRGEAVAVSVSQGRSYCTAEPRPEAGRVTIQQLGGSGAVGAPRTLTMPGFFNVSSSQGPSVTLDDDGRAAVGLAYQDGASPASCEPHSRECCSQAAVMTSSEAGGAGALTLQTLSSPTGVDRASGVPVIAIDGSTVTAVWERDASGVDPEEEASVLEQAHGPFGSTLRASPLTVAPLRISALDLASNGTRFASWLGSPREPGHEAGVLHSATTRSSGGVLELRPHGRRLFGARGQAIGFAEDDAGDTTLAYEPEIRPEMRDEIAVVSAHDGGRFSRSRIVGRVPNLSQPKLLAGGRRSLMLVWDGSANRVYAQRGTAFGRFGTPERVAGDEGSYDAFIDARGRAVVLYDRRVAHRRGLWEEVARTARSGGRFGAAHRIAPPTAAGVLGLGPSLAAVSPDGHAVILVGRDARREYLIRYTP